MDVTDTSSTSTAVEARSADPHPWIQKVRHSTVPIAELIGFRIDEIASGRAVASLRSGSQHANPMGTLHGGVLCDLADAAMGMAFLSTVAPHEARVVNRGTEPGLHRV